MAKLNQIVDKLTNSIVNRLSGDSFDTDVIKVSEKDLKSLSKLWNFNWKKESKESDIYKLVIRSSPDVIQGLISIEKQQGFIFVKIVETAPHNYGQNKVYEGVLGNMMAFACKLSFENGNEGFVAFDAKTKLIEHYTKSLRAQLIGTCRMFIDTKAAMFLVNTYFNK